MRYVCNDKSDAHSWQVVYQGFVDLIRHLFLDCLSQCADFVQMPGVAFGLWHQPMQPSLTSYEAVLKCCTASSFPSPGFKLFELPCV